MVECTRLESEQTVKGLGSSNLPLSVENGAAKPPVPPRAGTRRPTVAGGRRSSPRDLGRHSPVHCRGRATQLAEGPGAALAGPLSRAGRRSLPRALGRHSPVHCRGRGDADRRGTWGGTRRSTVAGGAMQLGEGPGAAPGSHCRGRGDAGWPAVASLTVQKRVTLSLSKRRLSTDRLLRDQPTKLRKISNDARALARSISRPSVTWRPRWAPRVARSA